MSGSTIRIVEMPDIGAVTDASSVVGERAGSGRFSAPALKTYTSVGMASAVSVPGLNARSYGATGDGVTDDTAALQAAINAAVAAQQMLYIPGGRYRLTAALLITRGVRIIGAYAEPQVAMFTVSPNTPGNGTWLMLDAGHLVSAFYICPTGTPSANNQAMGVEIGCLGIYHQQPVPGAGWAPAAYPPAINIPAGSDVNLHDLCLFNPTSGILANVQSAGRLVIERITGQPLNTGILLDNQTDTVVVRDVHFWVNWSLDPTVLAYMKASATGLVLYRIDNPVIDNFLCLWYSVGASIKQSPDGHGTPGGVRLTNCDFDECVNPVVIGAGNNIVVFMSGCLLAGPAEDAAAAQSGLTILTGAVGAQVFMSTCSIWENGANAVNIATGTNSHVRLAACQIYEWDRLNTGNYAFQGSAGSSIRADAATLTFSTNSNTRVLAGGQSVKAPAIEALKGTMGSGATSVVIPHTLGALPDVVLVTPNPNAGIGSATLWFGVADATNVNVACNVAPGVAVPFSVLLGFIN